MMVGIAVDLMLTLHIVVSVNAVMIVVVMQQVQVSTLTNFSKEFQIIEVSRKHGLTSTTTFYSKRQKVISKVTKLIEISLNRL